MKLIYLSKDFYSRYAGRREILRKENRPYVCVSIVVDSREYAIPFRHHISHGYAFFTTGKAGLDYTKAVPILDASFVSGEKPHVDSAEYRIIKVGERRITAGFMRYLALYRKALEHKDNPHYANIIRFSALQYFDI